METLKRGQGQGWGHHHLLFEQRHRWENGCDWGLTLPGLCGLPSLPLQTQGGP